MKTFTLRVDPDKRNWYVVDLQDATLGRAAITVANVLRGKSKPIFSPHIDNGDHVIVVNAGGVRVTGKKMEQKKYYRYSGYPGGLRETSMAQMLTRKPEEVFRLAVRGMLPKNRLGRKQLKKLHIYAGPEHPHQAQKPEKLEIK